VSAPSCRASFEPLVTSGKSAQSHPSCLSTTAVDEARDWHGCTALPGSSSDLPTTCYSRSALVTVRLCLAFSSIASISPGRGMSRSPRQRFRRTCPICSMMCRGRCGVHCSTARLRPRLSSASIDSPPSPLIGCYVRSRRPNSERQGAVSWEPCGKKLPSERLTFTVIGLDLRVPKPGAQLLQCREIVFNLSERRGASISRKVLEQFRGPCVGLS
jgi:hypothetical protein